MYKTLNITTVHCNTMHSRVELSIEDLESYLIIDTLNTAEIDRLKSQKFTLEKAFTTVIKYCLFKHPPICLALVTFPYGGGGGESKWQVFLKFCVSVVAVILATVMISSRWQFVY